MAVGTKVGEAWVELQLKMAKFESKLKSAEVMTGKSVNKMQAKFQTLAPTMKKVGMGMTVAGGAITAAVVGTFKAFTDYEIKLVDMAKVTSESFESIEKKISGIDPILGSSTELMAGYYQVISAGVKDPIEALNTLTIAAQTAKAAHVEQSEVVKGITKMMAGYEGAIENVSEAADLLFAIEKEGQTSVAELIPYIGGLTKVSHDLEIGQYAMGAAIATISKTAGSTAEAATQYEAVLTGLMKPTDYMTKAMSDMGYETAEAAIAELGLVKVLQNLEEVTGGSSQALGELFGRKEAMVGFSALSAEGFETLNDTIIEVTKGVGGQKKAFDEWSESGQASIDEIKNTFINFGIDIGKILAPKIKELIGKVTDIIKAMSDWAKEHPALTDMLVKFVAILGALMVTGGPMLILAPTIAKITSIIPALIGGLGAIKGAIIAMHVAIGPIGWAIEAIIAAIVLLYVAWTKNWGGIQEKTRAVVNFISKYFIKFVNFISQNVLNPIISGFETLANAISGTIGNMVGGIIDAFGYLPDSLLKIFGTSQEEVKAFAVGVRETFQIELGRIPEIAEDALTWRTPEKTKEDIKEDFKEIAKTQKGWITRSLDEFSEYVDGLEAMEDSLEPLPEVVKSAYEAMEEGAGDAGEAQEELSKGLGKMKDAVIELGEEEKKRMEEVKRQIEERLAAEKNLLQEIFELIHTKMEIDQKAFDEKIKQLRELEVSEELIQKLIAARNAKIQEEITKKEAEEAEKRKAKAREEAEEKKRLAEEAAQKRIEAEVAVTDRIFELTHTREEINQKAFDRQIEQLKELGVSDELIQQLIVVRRAKIQEEITAKEKEETDKRLEESKKETDEKKRLAEEAAEVRMRLEEEVTQKIFELIHTREEIEQRAFDEYIARLREKEVDEEHIAALIEAREAKLQEEITNKEREEAEKREKIAKDEQDEKERLAQETADKRIAAEERITQKIFELTHTREEVSERQFQKEMEQFEALGVKDELISKLIVVRRAKIQEEITEKEAEEIEKRLEKTREEAEKKIKLAEEATQIRIALEQEVSDKIFELIHTREEIEQRAFDEYIARLKETGVSDHLISQLRAAYRAEIEEEITKKEAEEAEKREKIAEDGAEKKKKLAREVAEERKTLEEEVTQRIFELTHTREEIEQKAFDKYIESLHEKKIEIGLIEELIAAHHSELQEEMTKKTEEEVEKRLSITIEGLTAEERTYQKAIARIGIGAGPFGYEEQQAAYEAAVAAGKSTLGIWRSYQYGGLVPEGKPILAQMDPGELVLPRGITRALTRLLGAPTRGPGYQQGGVVGTAKATSRNYSFNFTFMPGTRITDVEKGQLRQWLGDEVRPILREFDERMAK